MSTGPARSGLFVYAKDVSRLAAFYQAVLGSTRVRETGEMVVLGSPGLQIVVHAMPPAIAAGVAIATPPVPRDAAALKFFFAVDALAASADVIVAHGGFVLPERYPGPGFVVCNAVDPEGNIFQLREFA